ncbi:hypothetical protein [Scytonema sp. PRP1]|uniref:hypothetical protein n=1 Tax=Scytonema sp. PRP1 TaxID=3120513 RepID=UPI00300BFE42
MEQESTIFECNACIRYPTAQPLEDQQPRWFVKRGGVATRAIFWEYTSDRL